jgi:redox-sensing transcriptional repressor
MEAEGQEITSSRELGTHLGISSAQIRKDLSQFGEFGKQGTGYNIEFLIAQLQKILQVEKVWDVVLIGAGDLSKIGRPIGPFAIESTDIMVDRIRALGVKIAMLTVPAHQAQKVAEKLVEAGVRAILSYAPTSLKVPEDVRIQYIDPVLHLQHMTYYVP